MDMIILSRMQNMYFSEMSVVLQDSAFCLYGFLLPEMQYHCTYKILVIVWSSRDLFSFVRACLSTLTKIPSLSSYLILLIELEGGFCDT